jgi:cell fate (sporulation/competence/biofilm development) regulator YlbF (YheA/YmcA/DUF963 family)
MTQSREPVSDVLAMESPGRDQVDRAARDFAAAMSETPEFRAFEQAYVRFRDDRRAQEELRAFEEKQRSLQALLMLNAVGNDELAELERLRDAWRSEDSVVGYVEAQAALSALCRATDHALSEKLGLGFARVCRPSCCG